MALQPGAGTGTREGKAGDRLARQGLFRQGSLLHAGMDMTWWELLLNLSSAGSTNVKVV